MTFFRLGETSFVLGRTQKQETGNRVLVSNQLLKSLEDLVSQHQISFSQSLDLVLDGCYCCWSWTHGQRRPGRRRLDNAKPETPASTESEEWRIRQSAEDQLVVFPENGRMTHSVIIWTTTLSVPTPTNAVASLIPTWNTRKRSENTGVHPLTRPAEPSELWRKTTERLRRTDRRSECRDRRSNTTTQAAF